MTVRQRIWFTLEDPSFSTAARAISLCMLSVIALSVLGFLASSERNCRWVSAARGADYDVAPVELDSPDLRRVCDRDGVESPWNATELFCIIIFTIEYCIRFAVAGDPLMPLKIPSRRAFVLVPLNVIDLISIAPFYLELIVVASSADGSGSGQLSQLAILRVLRLARVVRIFKVSKSFSPVIVLVRTLGKSLNAILMLFCFVGLGVVLFSALMYYAEQGVYYESCRCFLREDGSVSPFEDIPASGWFAIVTMTTVGYGERTVVTASGKAVAAVCMVMGIIVIALPITIIGSTFDEELKLMDIEKRNHNLLALQAHLSRTLDSTATLTLVERVLSVHEANVDNMLAQIKEQMARQRAQLNGVLVALRTQIERNGVPTVDADAAKAERDVHQVLLASKFGYNIKRSLAIGHQKSKGIVARALTGAPSSTGPESSRLGADPSTPPATPPSMPRRTRLTAGSRGSNGRLD